MFKIHAIQAHEGDSLLIEHEHRGKRRYVLVDGGPPGTYQPHLQKTLKSKVTRNGGKLDLVVLSHVDQDHVVGLLDLFVELRSAKADGDKQFVKVSELWHNTFGLLDRTKKIGSRFESVMAAAQSLLASPGVQATAGQRDAMALANLGLSSIRQGERLAHEAKLLRVPTNKRFDGKPIVASGEKRKDTRTVNGLKIQIVGPTEENLKALRKEWKKWLDEQEEKLRRGQFNLAAMSDKSVPNLSSLQMLVQQDGKTALFTGDGRGDHLIEALNAAGLADAQGMDVDLLKVPHHGSDRNVTKSFFEKVRAKTYLVSADGKHGNPDYNTLKWIVDAAKEQNRKIQIVVTNETPTVKKLLKERPISTFKYKLKTRSSSRHSISVNV